MTRDTKQDEAFRMAYQLVGEGITARAETLTADDVRRRLDEAQDAIEAMRARLERSDR